MADLLTSLEQYVSKGSVFNYVQAAGTRAQHLRQACFTLQAGKLQVLRVDFTHVKSLGQDKIVAVESAILTGQPLTVEIIEAEASGRIEQWLRTLARILGAEILVTDDADGLKSVADHLGLNHQVCRAHVNWNVHDLIAALGTKAPY